MLDVLQCQYLYGDNYSVPYPMRLDRHREPLEKVFSHDKSEFLLTNHSPVLCMLPFSIAARAFLRAFTGLVLLWEW